MKLSPLLLLTALTLTSSLHADPAPIDTKALAATAVQTAEKLHSSPASWNTSNILPNGAIVHVSTLRAGSKQHITITLENNGQHAPLLNLIIRDGLWYATDRRGSAKYRPYELPTDSPIIYIALQLSQPVFFTPRTSQFKSSTLSGNIATLRTDLPPAQTKQLQALISQMESFSNAGHPLSAENQSQLQSARQLLANGLSTRIDTTTGQLVEFGSPKIRTRVDDFHFVDSVDDHNFSVDGTQWQDFSDDPTTGDLNNLAMIGNAPEVRPGDKNYELDGRLIDLKTGRFRRIPFSGAIVTPGCFTKNRLSVLVTGVDFNTSSLRPYEIDLKSQIARPLGSPLLDTGFTFIGDLSPDGKTLVVVHLDITAGPPLSSMQICLVDVATAVATPLGKPMDTAFVNWTADGQHLVLITRKYTDMNSPSNDSLAIMDMTGKITELRRGNAPVLLADRKTILYEDPPSRLWHTCDLQGAHDTLFADGLKGYGFPTPAPDGQRLLMLHYLPNQLPEPTILPIGSSQGQPVPHESGLWAQPAWR
jgi:hypothetical protein